MARGEKPIRPLALKVHVDLRVSVDQEETLAPLAPLAQVALEGRLVPYVGLLALLASVGRLALRTAPQASLGILASVALLVHVAFLHQIVAAWK